MFVINRSYVFSVETEPRIVSLAAQAIFFRYHAAIDTIHGSVFRPGAGPRRRPLAAGAVSPAAWLREHLACAARDTVIRAGRLRLGILSSAAVLSPPGILSSAPVTAAGGSVTGSMVAGASRLCCRGYCHPAAEMLPMALPAPAPGRSRGPPRSDRWACQRRRSRPFQTLWRCSPSPCR